MKKAFRPIGNAAAILTEYLPECMYRLLIVYRIDIFGVSDRKILTLTKNRASGCSDKKYSYLYRESNHGHVT
jgi:hypothetical protein